MIPVGTVSVVVQTETFTGRDEAHPSVPLDGRTLWRDRWPALWAWVLANDLVRPGLFDAGDGVSTFRVPDMRARVSSEARAVAGAEMVAVMFVVQG